MGKKSNIHLYVACSQYNDNLKIYNETLTIYTNTLKMYSQNVLSNCTLEVYFLSTLDLNNSVEDYNSSRVGVVCRLFSVVHRLFTILKMESSLNALSYRVEI